ncbi:MAG: hypothetical protein KF701_05540 [Anaerolineales bacterium]|nr:MAG: hypothetical protein KF701_05540 [Anaerolineales bacterium]
MDRARKFQKTFEKFSSSPFLIPVLMLAVMAVSMGIFVSSLGFYLDDWPNIFFQQAKGAHSTILFHAYDGRPLQGWYMVGLFELFGTSALAWQLYALVLRYLTALLAWLTLRKVWPGLSLQLGLASILFAVYPIFAQQPIAITFVVHWTSFLCVFLSIYLMLLAIEQPTRYIPYTITGVGLSALGLILIEYFAGLELLRLPILWFLLACKEPGILQRIAATLRQALPYLLVTATFVIWRVYFIELPVADRNPLALVELLRQQPLQAILLMLQYFFQDLVAMVVSGWYKTLDANVFAISSPVDLYAVGAGVVVGVGLYLCLVKPLRREPEGSTRTARRQVTVMGLASLALGLLPAWLIQRTIGESDGIWSDRFGMAGMLGAALLVVVLIWSIADRNKVRLALFAVLVGLACTWQVREINEYRWSWERQQRIFSQFMWRMPGLEPDTLIISLNEYFSKMGHYPTAFALNMLYPQTRDSEQVDYWYSPLARFEDVQMSDYLSGQDVTFGHWQAFFHGNTKDVVVVDLNKDLMSCLWVLGPEDELNPLIHEITRRWLANSDLSRISRTAKPSYPKWDVVREQSQNSWCYYFQKADLAAQFADWEEVGRLWETARNYLNQMNAYTELTPFIKGFLHLEQLGEAVDLSELMVSRTSTAEPYLCAIWQSAVSKAEVEAEDSRMVSSLMETLGCELKAAAP